MVSNTVHGRKAKGRDFQKEVAEKIRTHFNLEAADVVPVAASVPGKDIILSNRAKELFPYAIECKRTETASVWQWIKQAEQNGKGTTPIVTFRRNNSKPYVIIDLDSFIKLHDNKETKIDYVVEEVIEIPKYTEMTPEEIKKLLE